jgi:hypothetical protein
MRAALVVAPLLASVAGGLANEPEIEFAGETYHLDSHERAKLPDGSLGDGIAEFTLQGETVNDWSKLFAYHAYPGVPDNPALAAETLGKTVKQNNKDAQYALTDVPKSDEAIVDFLTWAPGSDIMGSRSSSMRRPRTEGASSPCSTRNGSKRTNWTLLNSAPCASAWLTR